MSKYNVQLGLKCSAIVESSPIDEFYFDEVLDVATSTKTLRHVNPLHLLLNQKRLDSLGTMGLDAWLQQFRVADSPLSELRKKCSDDDLCKYIKSRHLQSPAELQAWARSLDAESEHLQAEIKEVIEAEKAKLEAQNGATTSEEQVNT